MSKFTPGPWAVSEEHFGLVVSSVGTWIADLADNSLTTSDQRANALLVASAPAMYEALQKVSQTITLEHSLHPDYGWKEWLEKEILPALKAATGE